jgi:hypothetical protein
VSAQTDLRLNGRPHLLRHEQHDCLCQPFERREGVQHDAVCGRGADDALAVEVERAFLVEPGEALWRCLCPSSQGARGALKSARFLVGLLHSHLARVAWSLLDDNESIAQPFFANEVEQHGSMLRIEPNTAGRRWSAQVRGLIRAVDGVVAMIED